MQTAESECRIITWNNVCSNNNHLSHSFRRPHTLHPKFPHCTWSCSQKAACRPLCGFRCKCFTFTCMCNAVCLSDRIQAAEVQVREPDEHTPSSHNSARAVAVWFCAVTASSQWLLNLAFASHSHRCRSCSWCQCSAGLDVFPGSGYTHDVQGLCIYWGRWENILNIYNISDRQNIYINIFAECTPFPDVGGNGSEGETGVQ